jgi:hypothetical protein
MRPPPHDIQILLPVWGQRYTRYFLELCLPSLMASGNIPALAQLCRCSFVLLAPAQDAGSIEIHRLWARLQQHCAVSVTHIDDLVSQSSSTVLTLAYTLAIRASGSRALDTCFVPIVADYVFSDGSLRAAVTHILEGASAVLAGNFQIARERAWPRLSKAKGSDDILAVTARDLVDLSLESLHKTTVDQIVTGDQLHAAANRLFWPVDNHCMIGRFYLMHMIAVRPETADFVISAPSDYSLVPELCPSGNIARLTDSDDYFVVECQPDTSSASPAGRVSPRAFASSLGTWATSTHYENARNSLVFHSRAIPAAIAGTLVMSERFVHHIEANRNAPLPYRNHPLWARSLDHHIATAQTDQDYDRLKRITGDVLLKQRVDRAGHLRSLLLGRGPNFRLWHPLWKDALLLKRSLAQAEGDVAVVSDAPARARAWCDEVAKKGKARSVTHVRTASIFADALDHSSSVAEYDTIVCCLDWMPCDLGELLACLSSLVRSNGNVSLTIGKVFSEPGVETFVPIGDEIEVEPEGLAKEEAIWVTRGANGKAIQIAMMQYARKSVYSRGLAAVLYLIVAAGFAVASTLLNLVVIRYRGSADGAAGVSSLLITFRKTENGSYAGLDTGCNHRISEFARGHRMQNETSAL